MNEITDFDAWLSQEFTPLAVYMDDADCVEYVREDTTTIYRRVDQLLTLIYDETNEILIGFKLKGFKRILHGIRDRLSLGDDGFASLVGVLELVCTELGDELVQDPKRQSAYAAASKLAKDVTIELDLAA